MLTAICRTLTVAALLAAMMFAGHIYSAFAAGCETDTECEAKYGVDK